MRMQITAVIPRDSFTLDAESSQTSVQHVAPLKTRQQTALLHKPTAPPPTPTSLETYLEAQVTWEAGEVLEYPTVLPAEQQLLWVQQHRQTKRRHRLKLLQLHVDSPKTAKRTDCLALNKLQRKRAAVVAQLAHIFPALIHFPSSATRQH